MFSPLSRHWSATVSELLDGFPVVVLSGARQVGKSTIALALARERGGTYLTLDDVSIRTQALADPDGLVGGQQGFVVFDEVQTVPDLLRAIKLSVDRDRRPGRFLLTGSANLLRQRTVGESLAGRSAWIELPPLLWSEIAQRPFPKTLDAAFAAGDAADLVRQMPAASLDRIAEARTRAIAGGMPPTLPLSETLRRAWYDGYRQTFLERDLRQLADIENLPEFVRLLNVAALRTATLLNQSALARDVGLSHATLRRYLSLLEVAYQFYELPPYFANLGKRLVKTPKLYAVDVGLVAYLGGLVSWNDAAAQGRAGAMLETWAIGELRALDRLSSAQSTMSFYRTSSGSEVDLVLERGPRIVAIEVKAGTSVGSGDLAGLSELRDRLGARFHLGIVATLGETAVVLGDRLCAIPLPSLLGVTAEPSVPR